MRSEKIDIILFFISKVLIGIIGFVSITLYSNLLLPSEYGDYSLISSLVSALVAIFIGWIASSSLRYYIDYKDDETNKKTFYFNVFLYTLAMFLIIAIIIIAVGFISKKIPIMNYLIITVLYAFNFSMVEVLEKILRASQETKLYAICMISQSLINIIMFFLLSKLFHLGAATILISQFISYMFFIIFSIIVLKIPKPTLNFCVDKNILDKFLKFGIPMIGIWGISWLLSYCDRYIIALYYDSTQVGIYDMSYKIAENSLNMVVTAFTLAIYPILIKTWKEKGKEETEKKVTTFLNYYMILILPAIVGLCMIVDKLYLGILDKQYISGKNVIIVICIGMFFNGLNAIFNKIWQLNEKTKKIFYIMLASVVLNIILNILLIPHYGIVFAALTTLISYIFTCLLTLFFSRKEFTVKIDYRKIFKIALCTCIMALFLKLFNNLVTNTALLLIEIILAIVIYLIFILIFKIVDYNEIKSFIRRGK